MYCHRRPTVLRDSVTEASDRSTGRPPNPNQIHPPGRQRQVRSTNSDMIYPPGWGEAGATLPYGETEEWPRSRRGPRRWLGAAPHGPAGSGTVVRRCLEHYYIKSIREVPRQRRRSHSHGHGHQSSSVEGVLRRSHTRPFALRRQPASQPLSSTLALSPVPSTEAPKLC